LAIKRNNAGQYIIASKAEAVRALAMMQELQDEYSMLMRQHGLDELQMDITELKRAATAYCANNEIEVLPVPKIGKVAKLVRAVNLKKWIGTKADLEEMGDKVSPTAKPLRSLVDKEVWMQITTRIPDPKKIDEAVAEGVITANKIAPAYVETFKAPYLLLVNGDKSG
jgi:hypothetical protein